jgi:hypothetical protein
MREEVYPPDKKACRAAERAEQEKPSLEIPGKYLSEPRYKKGDDTCNGSGTRLRIFFC